MRKTTFFKKTLYPPSGMVWPKITIFSITQPFLKRSFSSSNSTEILMRQLCAQSFSSIECDCEELSCKRPAGRTHRPIILVYSLFEYTKNSIGSDHIIWFILDWSIQYVHSWILLLFEYCYSLMLTYYEETNEKILIYR